MARSHRSAQWVLLLVMGLAALGWGCSSKGPRYPEDHARFERIYSAVQALQSAYVHKDLPGLRNLVLPLDPMDRLEQEFKKDFEIFQEISLDFSIERIVIEGETIDVFIHWQGQWKKSETDVGMRDTGHGKLRWVGEKSILLQSVEGDLPFGISMKPPPQARLEQGARG